MRPPSFSDAEQFGLDARRRHHGAIDGDKGVARAPRQRMDQTRGDFLARARGTGDEDAAARRRDLVDELAQLRDRGRTADELGVVARLQLQLLDFALQPRGFQRAAHDMDQPVGLERLFDEIVGALFDRGDGGLDRAVAADDHHRQIGMLALEHVEDLDAVEPASLQPDVEHDQMRPAVGDRGQGAVGIGCDTGLVAFVGENARHELADIDLVVDDENLRRDQRPVLVHASTPARSLLPD